MMGIVHDALRRDIARALGALSSSPTDAQRVALGQHIGWMMRFLHRHHHGEDAGLWPLVRERDERVSRLLEAMEADHKMIAPMVDKCTTTAYEYATSNADSRRISLIDALQELATVLLPHLQREEDDAMPIVSITISAPEWKAVDHEYFLKDRSLADLAFEGHWLLDGLDAERADIVVHQVPLLQRLVLLHGFGRRYHRHAAACWGDAGPHAYRPAGKLPHRIPPSGRAEAVVDAPLDDVWRVVRDVTRVPEWSRECRHVEWLDGATEALPGARFRGANRAGPFTWHRINEVIAVQAPYRLVWRTVPTRRYPDSSEWRIDLDAEGAGTRITQTYSILRGPKMLALAYSVLVRSHRDRSSELVDDLRRIGQIATGAPAPARRSAQ